MASLRARIAKAFPLEPVPPPPIIATYDDEDIIPTFLGRRWDTFTVRELREHDTAITYLTDDAFLYYLPAFLVASLDDPEAADTIPERLLWKFGRPDAADLIGRLGDVRKPLVLEFLSGYVGDDECLIRDLVNALDQLDPGWNTR